MAPKNTKGKKNKESQIANINSEPPKTNNAQETGTADSSDPDPDMPTFQDHVKASVLFGRPTLVHFLPLGVQITVTEFQKYINISEKRQRRKRGVQHFRKIAPKSIMIEKPAKRPYHRKSSTATSLALTPVGRTRSTGAITTTTYSATQGIPSTGIYDGGLRGPVLVVDRPPPTFTAVVPSDIQTSSPHFGTNEMNTFALAPSSTSMDSGAIHSDSIVRNSELVNPKATTTSISRQLLQTPKFLPSTLQNQLVSVSQNNNENETRSLEIPSTSLRRILPHTDSSSSQASGSSNFGSNLYPLETQRSSSTLNPEYEIGAQALKLRRLSFNQESPEFHADYQYGQNSNLGFQQWAPLAQQYQKQQDMDFTFNNEMSYELQIKGISSSPQPFDQQQMYSYAESSPEPPRYPQSQPMYYHAPDAIVYPTNQYLPIPPPIRPTQNNNEVQKNQQQFNFSNKGQPSSSKAIEAAGTYQNRRPPGWGGIQEPMATNMEMSTRNRQNPIPGLCSVPFCQDCNYIKHVHARWEQLKQLKQQHLQLQLHQHEQLKLQQPPTNDFDSLDKDFTCAFCGRKFFNLKQLELHFSRH